MKKLKFPKASRLIKNNQFRIVLSNRLSASDELLYVSVCRNNCKKPRLGVSISKSCGSAVVRNRLKRLIREAFRQNQNELPAGFDYLVSMSYNYTRLRLSAEVLKNLKLEKISQSLVTLAKCAIRQKA